MSAIVRRPPPRVTLEDFLAWPGDGTAKRYQLVDGEIRAMSPASTTHSRIQARLAYLIERQLEEAGSSCAVFNEAAVVPRVRSDMNLRVPDLAVTWRPDEISQVILSDPVLLIEILSPGNESDTRENVWAYTTMPSVHEILIVHSTRIAAEVLRRSAEGSWPAKAETLEDQGTLCLHSIGFSVALTQLYVRTHLARG